MWDIWEPGKVFGYPGQTPNSYYPAQRPQQQPLYKHFLSMYLFKVKLKFLTGGKGSKIGGALYPWVEDVVKVL